MRNILFVPIAALTAMASCTEADAPLPDVGTAEAPSVAEEEPQTPTVEGCTVLGGRIPLPYTTDVMRRALESLRAGNKSAAAAGTFGDDIATTHLYLRFAPRDSADMAALEGDTAIMFTEVPMDAEIAAVGDYYHDPSLPDSVPTYQYCAVRVGQPLPDVPHETLAELFLMEETNVDDDAPQSANKSADPLWEALEAEAYALVGLSLDGTPGDDEAVGNKSKWRPGGRLRYRDTTLGDDIPLEGVPVRYQKLVVVHQCCTDAEGCFSFGRRRSSVRYYAKWRRDDFHIRGLGKVFAVAETQLSGSVKRQVDVTIGNPESAAWKYASVFRAAHHYYYKHAELGLSKPGDRNLCIRFSSRLPGNAMGQHFGWHLPGVSDIYIYYHHSGLSASCEYFCTTFHEIAHSAHRKWDSGTYRDCDKKVSESWARGVSYYATDEYYKKRNGGSAVVDRSYFGNYTGVVGDLMDSNVNGILMKSGKTVYDKVQGFSISEIEGALRGVRSVRSWNGWCENLKRMRNDENERNEIQSLFDAWGNYYR